MAADILHSKIASSHVHDLPESRCEESFSSEFTAMLSEKRARLSRNSKYTQSHLHPSPAPFVATRGFHQSYVLHLITQSGSNVENLRPKCCAVVGIDRGLSDLIHLACVVSKLNRGVMGVPGPSMVFSSCTIPLWPITGYSLPGLHGNMMAFRLPFVGRTMCIL